MLGGKSAGRLKTLWWLLAEHRGSVSVPVWDVEENRQLQDADRHRRLVLDSSRVVFV